jgi:hypothetical protein
MTTTQPRYRLRVTGSKYDYIRRYYVIDSVTGKRVARGFGPMTKDDAQDTADDLNDVPLEDRA